ncbi:MAG: efflux RND transporter permease subunit [Alphaproteobacteria bacterium]|nr:efflux RND transporter permease subunit [Alphaproteobacteria bacterium]
MIGLLLASACSAAPREVTVEVYAPWPGASVDEIEQQLAIPLEKALSELPDAHMRTEIVPGLARVTFDLPAGALSATNGALHRVPLPPGAPPPWPQARAETATTFVVTGADEATLTRATAAVLEVGAQWWGPDKVFASTDTRLSWTATLARGGLDESALPRGGTLEDALATEVGGQALSAWLTGAPVAAHPDRWATWDGRPAAVIHVAGDGADLVRVVRERFPELVVERWPKRGARVDLWGPDAEEQAAAVAERAKAAGAAHVAVVVGRGPLPGMPARRAEVFADGLGAGDLEGAEAWSKPEHGRMLAEGGGTAPPPGPEWDVSLDPDRLGAVGLDVEDAARQVRLVTAGVGVPLDDGVLHLRLGAEPRSADDLVSATVTLPGGEIVPLADIAEIHVVQAPRYRVRQP